MRLLSFFGFSGALPCGVQFIPNNMKSIHDRQTVIVIVHSKLSELLLFVSVFWYEMQIKNRSLWLKVNPLKSQGTVTARDGILIYQFDKRLKSFASRYSQSFP